MQHLCYSYFVMRTKENQSKANKKSTSFIGIACMLIASFLFSTGGVLIKIIPWNPLAINGVRNVIAAVVIGIYIAATHHKIKVNLTVIVGAVCLAGVTTLFSVANKMTTAGNVIILQNTAPVWIVILLFLIFGKKPTKIELISILIVFAGILCFFFEGIASGKWLGNLFALLSGIFYAGVFMLNSFEKGDALSSVFFGQLGCALIFSPMVAHETDFTFPVLLAVFLLGAFQVGIAYIFFTTGTKYTDPVTASIINAIEPILNPTLVAVFYGEMLGPLSLVGAAIVMCGILYYNIKKAAS